MRITCSIIMAALLAGGCAATTNPASEAEPVKFEPVESGTYCRWQLQEPKLFAIATEQQWTEFAARHARIITEPPGKAPVDFNQWMLIAVVDKVQSTGGYSLKIQKLLLREDKLEVHTLRRQPGRGCIVTMALTQPYDIVRVAKTAARPQLVLTTETYHCD
jgi:hypothetical protein